MLAFRKFCTLHCWRARTATRSVFPRHRLYAAMPIANKPLVADINSGAVAHHKLTAGKTLINDYLARDEIGSASVMLDTLRRLGHFPDVDVYNRLIRGWLQEDNIYKAMEVFEKMRKDGRAGTSSTFSMLIDKTVRARHWGQLKHVVDALNARQLPLDEWLAVGASTRAEEVGALAGATAAAVAERMAAQGVAPSSMIKVTTEEDTAVMGFDEDPAPASLYDQQIALETRAIDRAVARYQKMMREVTQAGQAAALRPAQRQLLLWYQPLVHALKAEQKAVAARLKLAEAEDLDELVGLMQSGADPPGERADGKEVDRTVGPYLLMLSPQVLAVITMHELLGLLLRKTNGVTFATACLDIGRAVQAEHSLRRMRDENSAGYGYLNRQAKQTTVSLVNQLARRSGHDDEWPRAVLAKIGGALIRVALERCRVLRDVTALDDAMPSVAPLVLDPTTAEAAGDSDTLAAASDAAFEHVYRVELGKRRGYLVAHANVYRLIEAGHKLRETLHARHLPMVVPPRDWTDINVGGYLQSPVSVMRTRGSREQKAALRQADLTLVYDALNALGATPWRVNHAVYLVAKRAWDEGGGLADLPLRTDVPLPSKAADFATHSHAAKQDYFTKLRLAQKTNAELHSLRCDVMLKLQVAQELVSKVLYMPHNLDFRGRAYPVPPHLNHIGSDLCRGMLWFAEARPLGEVGLRWLKIHLANVYGMNKMSFDERVAWVDAHREQLEDSARAPLDGARWWLGAEDPWQTLATCFELSAALRSPNPAAYASRLPVHQDGTCNGLQHYAALGGDRFGAAQVNLEPSERPQDVYSGVAELVRARVAADAAEGSALARKLDGHVDRKIVKQTVMTSVYGVTFPGANLQIRARLHDTGLLPEAELQQASTYLTRLTFDALREMFLGARNIMQWLAECARIVAKAGAPVSWITPVGLTVVQPYRRATARQQVRTVVQTVVLAETDEDIPVHVARQQSAFPPNYVHSLDSTHMLLTARACRDAGIAFASVHDSFWTHASTVPQMAGLLRQEFVELHSQPLLAQLKTQLEVRNGVVLPPVPERGSLNLRNVLASPYFFS